jgi:hypothetical protein
MKLKGSDFRGGVLEKSNRPIFIGGVACTQVKQKIPGWLAGWGVPAAAILLLAARCESSRMAQSHVSAGSISNPAAAIF